MSASSLYKNRPIRDAHTRSRLTAFFNGAVVLAITACHVATLILLLAQIVIRNAYPSASPVWLSELARMTNVWFVFLGLIWASSRNEHIVVDLISRMVSKRPRTNWVLTLIVRLVTTSVGVLLAMGTLSLVSGTKGRTLPASAISTNWLYVIPCVAFLIFCVIEAVRVVEILRRARSLTGAGG